MSASLLAGLFKFSGRVAPRGQHDDLAGVGCRRLGGGVDPGLEVLDAVNDAAAELRITRTRAVDAMFLERADGEADEARSFWRAQVARRQTCEIGGHRIPP